MAVRNETLKALFPRSWRQWLGPIVALGAVGAIGAIIVISAGLPDLAASVPHPQGWAELLHYTFKQSVAHQSDDLVVPADQAATPVAKGAMLFDAVCANCHGRPQLGQSLVVLAMRPQPQYLPKVIGQFNDRELFWIVKHGVKYSAMPAWPTQRRDDEIWSIVAFLRQLPHLDAAAYARLTDPVPAPTIAIPARDPATPLRRVVETYPQPGTGAETLSAMPATGFGGERLAGNPVATCAGCHGAEGNAPRSGGIPLLSILDAETIRAALADYASGQRASGFMQPLAQQLTPAQMVALAHWFAADTARHPPAPQATPTPADPQQLLLGERIAVNGIAGRRVAACQNCHAVNRATEEVYPAIAGQDWRYLRDQLRLYRAGIRHAASSVRPMASEALQLTDREIDAVAAWYASRAPRAPAPVRSAPTRDVVPVGPGPTT